MASPPPAPPYASPEPAAGAVGIIYYVQNHLGNALGAPNIGLLDAETHSSNGSARRNPSVVEEGSVGVTSSPSLGMSMGDRPSPPPGPPVPGAYPLPTTINFHRQPGTINTSNQTPVPVRPFRPDYIVQQLLCNIDQLDESMLRAGGVLPRVRNPRSTRSGHVTMSTTNRTGASYYDMEFSFTVRPLQEPPKPARLTVKMGKDDWGTNVDSDEWDNFSAEDVRAALKRAAERHLVWASLGFDDGPAYNDLLST